MPCTETETRAALLSQHFILRRLQAKALQTLAIQHTVCQNQVKESHVLAMQSYRQATH